MKNYLLISAFSSIVLMFFCSMDTPKFKTTKLTDGITAKIPDNFMPMSEQDLATRYPSTKKPLAMFNSMDGFTDFGLNVTKSNWAGKDLNLLKDIYKSTLYTMYSDVKILKEEIKTINKNNFIVLEFISLVDQTKKYSYMQYGVFNNRVYIFNFTCLENEKEQYMPVATQIMESIKIKPSKLKAIEYVPNGENNRKGKNTKDVLLEQKNRMGTKTTQPTPQK